MELRKSTSIFLLFPYIVSCFGLTISLFVSSFSDFGQLEYINHSFDLKIALYFLFIPLVFFLGFLFPIKKYLGIIRRTRSLFLWRFYVIFFWIPVFLFYGISGENRIEYWSLFPLGNLGSYLNFFYYISIFTCFYASRPLFIFIVSLLIVFLAGERVTGFIAIMPMLLPIKAKAGISWRQTGLIAFLLLSLSIGFKYLLYYQNDITLFLARISSQASLVSSLGIFSTLFGSDNWLISLNPYGNWGQTASTFLLQDILSPSMFNIAESTQGQVGLTLPEVLTFYFGYIPTIPILFIIGCVYGVYIQVVLTLMASRKLFNIYAALFLFLVFGKRFMGILTNGFLGDIFRLENLAILIVVISVYILYIPRLRV